MGKSSKPGMEGFILYRFFILFFLIVISVSAQGAVIQFPDQELASEYVFPVFKDPKAVMNRDVTLSKRFELRLSHALRTDEPFYSSYSASTSLAFYWNESHGIGISGLFFFPGLSSTGNDLKKVGVKKAGTEVVDSYYDAELAPHPFLAGFVNYQFSPLYGKISISKNLVFNFALYSFFGLGVVNFRHGNAPLITKPASHFGVGQRFYFNRYFALDGGIDFLLYYGANPVLGSLKWTPDQNAPARPAYDKFREDVFLRFLARIGVTVLL